MMDSMTEKEMASHPMDLQKGKNYDNRIRRIACGSGYPVSKVKEFM